MTIFYVFDQIYELRAKPHGIKPRLIITKKIEILTPWSLYTTKICDSKVPCSSVSHPCDEGLVISTAYIFDDFAP